MTQIPNDAWKKQLLTRPEVAEMLKVSAKVLCNWAVSGRGPQFVKVGRLVRYRMADLEKWLSEHTVKTEQRLI